MIIAVDSSALALIINPDAVPPIDPGTGKLLTSVQERVELLLAGLTAADTLLVPTPVLSEILVKAGEAGPDVLVALQTLARIRIAAFDERAAVETAMMTRDAIAQGDKRSGSDQPWQKVKFDRQIIAIARVHAATLILADDNGLVAFAHSLGMDVMSSWDLPLPAPTSNLFTAVGLPADGRGSEDDPSGPA